MSDADKQITETVRGTLNQSVERLPAEVRSRLTQARHQALAAAGRSGSARHYPWLIPAGGFAAVMLVVALWQNAAPPQLPGSLANAVAAQDLEMLLSAEDLDLVEDLEFLLWLQEQTDAG